MDIEAKRKRNAENKSRTEPYKYDETKNKRTEV